MESHELTTAVDNIENTLKEILNVLRDMQAGQQVECSNVAADKEQELLIANTLAEITKPKKQTDKETN